MSHPPPLSATWQQADELRARGALVAARDLLEPAVDVAAMRLGPDDRTVVETQRRLAVVHRELGELAQARRVLEESLDGGLLGLGEADPLILRISAELGAIADELGNKHEARRNLARVARFGPAVLGADHPYVRTAQQYLGIDVPLPVTPTEPAAANTHQPTTPAEPATANTYQPTTPAQPAWPMEPEGDQADPVPRWEPIEPGVYRSTKGQRIPAQQPTQPAEAALTGAVPPPTALVPAPPGTTVLPAADMLSQPEPVPDLTLPRDWAAPHFNGVRPATTAPTEASRRGWWIALGVLLSAGLLAGLGAAALTLAHRPSPATSAPSDPASPSPSPAAAPKDLKLRDDGTSVTLTWSDPSSGSVPFLIAGGRVGDKLRAFQSLPAGQIAYTVNGLNPTLDYCFTVVATYSTTYVATSDPVCTDRRHQPTAGPSR